MVEYVLSVNMSFGGDTHAHTQTDTDINTMTRPGLGAGQSESASYQQRNFLDFTIQKILKTILRRFLKTCNSRNLYKTHYVEDMS